MCIIIDANTAHLVFGKSKNEDTKPIFDWLFDADKDGCIAYGGKLTSELMEIEYMSRTLKELNRSGRVNTASKDKLEKEEQDLMRSGHYTSDDPHVLALARVTGARVIFTQDGALRNDFRNPDIIKNPRGKLYTTARNKDLLIHTSSCKKKAHSKKKTSCR